MALVLISILVKFMQRQISREFMGFFKAKEIEGDVRKLTSAETSEISKTKLGARAICGNLPRFSSFK